MLINQRVAARRKTVADRSLHEVARQVSDQRLRRLLGQEEMCQVVHARIRYALMKRFLVALLPLIASSLFAIDAAEFAARRARLAKEIGPAAMLVVFSAKAAIRNGDVEYPFRQSDDLLYLTGIAEPESMLVMLPGEAGFSEVIFTRERNLQQELYTGRVPSSEDITKRSGVKT